MRLPGVCVGIGGVHVTAVLLLAGGGVLVLGRATAAGFCRVGCCDCALCEVSPGLASLRSSGFGLLVRSCTVVLCGVPLRIAWLCSLPDWGSWSSDCVRAPFANSRVLREGGFSFLPAVRRLSRACVF